MLSCTGHSTAWRSTAQHGTIRLHKPHIAEHSRSKTQTGNTHQLDTVLASTHQSTLSATPFSARMQTSKCCKHRAAAPQPVIPSHRMCRVALLAHQHSTDGSTGPQQDLNRHQCAVTKPVATTEYAKHAKKNAKLSETEPLHVAPATHQYSTDGSTGPQQNLNSHQCARGCWCCANDVLKPATNHVNHADLCSRLHHHKLCCKEQQHVPLHTLQGNMGGGG